MALVVHAGGEFLGTASVIVSDEDARPNLSPWIAAVWVEPHARNRGVGAALVEHAAQAAFALGHDALYLGASTRRRSFYEKRGWRAHEEDVPRPGMAILTRGRP
jgi:GNAT superfamily N-acetyltransferase